MLINLPCAYNLEPSPPRSTDMVFYAPDQSDFLFVGGHVRIYCQPIRRALTLDWTLHRNAIDAPLTSGSNPGQVDNSFALDIPVAQFGPGFYDLKVRLKLTETDFLAGRTTFGWRADEEPIVSVRPDDFLAFWRTAQEGITATSLDLRWEHQFTLRGAEEIGRYNREHAALPERFDPEGERTSEVEVVKADFAAPGGGRVYCWFAKPVGPGPFPGLLVLPGGGNGKRPAPVEHARHGFAAIDVHVHGSPVDAESYPRLPEPTYTTPQEYEHFEVYRNALQAVSALSALPGVDAERLAAAGGSRGGRLSMVVAALDPRIRAAVPGIAHFANLPWLHWTENLNQQRQAGKKGFTREDISMDPRTVIESYFDIVNYAPLARCPILMNMGLIDPVSLPTAVYAAFRSVTGPKEMIPLPNLAHDWSPAFDRYAWKWLAEALDNQ